jgi:hypothetical protein
MRFLSYLASFRALLICLTASAAVSGGTATAQLLVPVDGPLAELERTTLPAAGTHKVVLRVARFGRYAISVSSEQGVALQLVDRMAGPGEVQGIAGEEDGRIDLFLDYGEYLVITTGHPQAEGEATLSVQPFAEANPDPAPQLVELKPVVEQLLDHQQRSYWLQIKKRRWVAFEAGGRTLRDLRLWLDGSWLVDARPATEVLDPVVGRPQLACRLVYRLEPGLYLLTAYGGREQAWADDNGDHPFYLRMGIPVLGTAGRTRYQLGPLGIDRWLVPAKASFFRIELPEALPATLQVGHYSESTPFAPGASARIDKESRLPIAEVTNSSDQKGYDVITVKATADQPYTLQHFRIVYEHRFRVSGEHWISTIHSGHPGDSIEATSFIAAWDRNRLQREPIRSQVVEIGSDGWASRCNLLEPLTVFLRVTSSGEYLIESEGTEAEFLIEPFFVYRPSNYKAPPFKRAGETWDLQEGYYVLTVRPVLKGILEMAIKPTGFIGNLMSRIGLGSEVERLPVRASNRFPSVLLYSDWSYTIFINRQPEVRTGLVLRQLPMSLHDPLPLTMQPQTQVTVPFTLSEPSLVTAVTEDGTRLPISVDDTPLQEQHKAGKGQHTVVVHHRQGEETIVCSVAAVPLRLLDTEPLPALPAGTLDSLPDLPVLTADRPQFFDLNRRQRTTFLVSATDDALYRLETTGLLDTEGNLRSRVVTSLARSDSGGSGRNLFLQQFMCAGDYQLTVSTRGDSRGHLGLELIRTDPEPGGELRLGLPARISLDDGGSVVYRFQISEPGRYRLRSYALGHTPRCRLEDGDGWPVVKPNQPANIDRHFEAGEYRLVLLPESVPGRRLTLLEKVEPPIEYEGHGPHQLPLATTVRHRWYEPEEDGAPRQPDLWAFELPGATEVSIRLTAEMHGHLIRRSDGGDQEAAYVPPMRDWQGPLEAGSYRFEVECVRRNNRVDYELAVNPVALLPGLERSLTAPSTVPVAIGDGGLVEISSFGATDVSARLIDSHGRTVVQNDDRANDWNFHLTGRLQPGAYSLQVSPVGALSATTTVVMDARNEVADQAQQLPFALTIEPGSDVHTIPISLPPAELLVVAARSAESIGLAVERQTADGDWQTITTRIVPTAQIELPLSGNDQLRLRLWSVDRRESPVTLTAAAVTPPHLSERLLAQGASVPPLAGIEPAVAMAAVELDRPGSLILKTASTGLRWSGATGQPLAPVAGGILQAPGTIGWIVVPAARGSVTVKALRARLEPGSGGGLQMPLASGRPALVDLDAGRGGPLLVIARSMIGQPAVRVVSAGTSVSPSLAGVAIADNAAAAVALTEPVSPAALAWLAGPASEPLDVRLTTISFSRLRASPARFGRIDDRLEPGAAAVAYNLPSGTKKLSITLTSGLVAAVTRGDQVSSLHWNGGQPMSEQLTTSGDVLLVLPTGDQTELFSVEILPADEAPVVTVDRPFETRLPVSGTLRLRIEPGGSPQKLHILGAAQPATFMSDDGLVIRGHTIEIGDRGGELLLPHETGLVIAWLATGDDPALALWLGVRRPRSVRVEAPQRLRLEGRVQSFRLEHESPVLLSISSQDQALFRLDTSGGTRAWVDFDSGTKHALLPAGSAELSIRALAGAGLGAELELLTSTVTEVGEGLGPEVLLAPGRGHAFQLTVSEPGQVGLGVRAGADTVDCELLTADGRFLGSGVVQMHELDAGDYLLLVRLPPDREAVRARPAVVGLERPSTGPPADQVRHYMELERSSR